MAHQHNMTRRQLLQALIASAMSLPLQPALAQPVKRKDYKALVCIFLQGGNDSYNMLIPSGSQYPAYRKARGRLAVHNNALSVGTGVYESAKQNPYAERSTAMAYLKGFYPLTTELGVNALMPEIARMAQRKRLNAVINSGALVQATEKKDKHKANETLPLFLFSHNHQQLIAQTANARDLQARGWGAAVNDILQATRGASRLSAVSYTGYQHWFRGGQAATLNLPRSGQIPRLNAMNKPFKAHQQRLQFLQEFNEAMAQENPWLNLVAEAQQEAINDFSFIRQVWDAHQWRFKSRNSYGEALFSNPAPDRLGLDKPLKGDLLKQLATVAKMIHLNAQGEFGDAGPDRQLFIVKLGGFDTHANQADKHPYLLRELSLALENFDTAMLELGYGQHVRTFTASDFGRTLSINGDGTDHAWGGHSVVTGDFSGCEASALGQLPDLALGSDDDFGNKGRFIPTISQDQVHASLAHWLGVPAAALTSVFPYLQNFSKQGDIHSALLKPLAGSISVAKRPV